MIIQSFTNLWYHEGSPASILFITFSKLSSIDLFNILQQPNSVDIFVLLQLLSTLHTSYKFLKSLIHRYFYNFTTALLLRCHYHWFRNSPTEMFLLVFLASFFCRSFNELCSLNVLSLIHYRG